MKLLLQKAKKSKSKMPETKKEKELRRKES